MSIINMTEKATELLNLIANSLCDREQHQIFFNFNEITLVKHWLEKLERECIDFNREK